MSPLVASVLLAAIVSVGGNPPQADTVRAQGRGSTPVAASAQTDADEIRRRVKDGQTILIVDDQGLELRGRIVGLTADALMLRVGHDRTDVPYERIVRIDRPHDGKLDGTLIGLGVGAGLGLIAAAATDDSNWGSPSRGHVALVGSLMFGGIGAAVGLGLDAAIRRETNIYRRPGATLSLSPTLGRSRRGVAIAVSW